MDGIPDASDPDGRRQNADAGTMRPFTGVLFLLGLALLLAALSVLVMLPEARHLRSFQDGKQASATLHTEGTCILGQCQVEFEADGRTVVADLPAGSGGGKDSAGTRMTVRYHADDPQVAVREEDLGGGMPSAMAVTLGGAASVFLVASVVGLVFTVRQRRADRMPGRTPQGRTPHGGTPHGAGPTGR